MFAGSLTTASSLMRPWQEGQLSTSTANVRAEQLRPRTVAAGRPRPVGWSLAAAGSSAGGFGAMRDLLGLAAASTPA